ncbi:MAG: tRNA pseudouridine(38-40) synthase TruA [Deltaproteobacteria bacterium]|jgi:tRNA pseudouridine38-40 synthase|nr:tRNA pseudouridine(38-40) synthase TruA [Deltaproteobacteria bacterium]
MARIKLTLAYLGTGFSGWQIQAPNQGKEARTVQGVLEDAVARLCGQPVRLHGSGRTDAGVHADGQIAHFDTPAGTPAINWRAALNSSLPPDLSVLLAEEAGEDFHARFSAKEKIYTYCLWLERAFIPPKLRDRVWACGPLGPQGLAGMDAAAALLIGEHDFAGFQNRGTDPADTRRTLHEISRFYPALPGENLPDPEGRYLAWRFRANGFLKQMVRNLAGFLVAVGQGRLTPEDARRALGSAGRAGLDFPTAPARGLSLTGVIYQGKAD